MTNAYTPALHDMTLRDYFAGQIISAVYKEYIAGVRNREHPCQEGWYVGVSIDAYRFADAMLKARKEPPTTW